MTAQDVAFSALRPPYAAAAAERLRAAKKRLAYYTNADTALKVIRAQEVWMRNVCVMNDYAEATHGLDMINAALSGGAARKLFSVLDAVFPRASDESLAQFVRCGDSLRLDTYLACFSEHADVEDDLGRLSMWRAYGGESGVALVFNSDAALSESDVFSAYTSPVMYGGAREVASQLEGMADAAILAKESIQQCSGDEIVAYLLSSFQMLALSTKHPAFREEQEWRVITNPTLGSSAELTTAVETVAGLPQRVMKLPLRDYPEQGLVGLALNKSLQRVIIGPTEFPWVVFDALSDAMSAVGIEKPGSRIAVSQIPLRYPRR